MGWNTWYRFLHVRFFLFTLMNALFNTVGCYWMNDMCLPPLSSLDRSLWYISTVMTLG